MPENQPQATTVQETVNTAADTARQDIPQQDSVFFENVLPTGEKEVFKTKEELAKAWQKSRFMERDYTQKTQEVAKTRKEIEEERKKFQEEQKAFLQTKQRYDKWDSDLRARPDLQRQLEQAFTQPMDASTAYQRAEGLVSEKEKALMERIEQLENRFKEGDSKREIEEAFSALKGKYEDADEGAIMEALATISDGKVGPLLEQLYWSHKGRLTPAQVEQKVVENLQKKSAAQMVPAGATRKSAPPVFKNTKDAREAAMAENG